MRRAGLEFIVGLFMLAGIVSLIFLAFKVSGINGLMAGSTYTVSADFQNVGDLKVHAPVTLSGVRIGEVSSIQLDKQSLDAIVIMNIEDRFNQIAAEHASANIYTQGLLGSNYIAIIPGYQDDPNAKPDFLKNGTRIDNTQPAIILENLIGQLLFNMKNSKS